MDTVDYSNEEWRDVLGWEGIYQVSDHGRVRRILICFSRPRPINPRINSYGYPVVALSHRSKEKRRYVGVHILVAESFISPRPKGKQTNHIDGIKTNNYPRNLEWITPKENVRHAHALGLCNLSPRPKRPNQKGTPRPSVRGELQHHSVMKTEGVLELRRLRGLGWGYKELMEKFKISKSTVSQICTRRSWKHV